MADPLYELLTTQVASEDASELFPDANDTVVKKYLARLSNLRLEALETTEPQSHAQAAHSTLLSLQALSTRSSKSIIASSNHLKSLRKSLPTLANGVASLSSGITELDSSAVSFAQKYARSNENSVLDRRKNASLMARNVDRLSDILDLPTLLSTAISSATAQGASSNTTYASALDLHSRMKRLHMLYPESPLLKAIYAQAEDSMREMTTNLIASLRGQNIKLAAGMRTVGWLRRIVPQLAGPSRSGAFSTSEGSLGALFLVCRLANLMSMLNALEPLRELADQETQTRESEGTSADGKSWAGGQQTERYLKRYIEIFREQSFGIVSLFKSIFPSDEGGTDVDVAAQFKALGLKNAAPQKTSQKDDGLQSVPSALATFPLHLVGLLRDTLKQYMPNIRDRTGRESLLTQVLYCAGSLGRLGGDFSMILAELEEEGDEDESDKADEAVATEVHVSEWVAIMKKHRELAGRLEVLASGQAKGGRSPVLPSAATAMT